MPPTPSTAPTANAVAGRSPSSRRRTASVREGPATGAGSRGCRWSQARASSPSPTTSSNTAVPPRLLCSVAADPARYAITKAVVWPSPKPARNAIPLVRPRRLVSTASVATIAIGLAPATIARSRIRKVASSNESRRLGT